MNEEYVISHLKLRFIFFKGLAIINIIVIATIEAILIKGSIISAKVGEMIMENSSLLFINLYTGAFFSWLMNKYADNILKNWIENLEKNLDDEQKFKKIVLYTIKNPFKPYIDK